VKSSKSKSIFHWFDGFLWRNPVLNIGLGVPFAVLCSTSMKNAACISIAMFFTAIPVFLLASLAAKYIPQWLRMPVYALTAAIALIPAHMVAVKINPALFDSLGIYFALMAMNPAVLIPALSHRISEEKPWFSLLHAICYSLGFTLVMFAIALIREPMGSGTLWGHPMDVSLRLSPIQYPFGGFLLLGYFAALYQLLERLFLQLGAYISKKKAAKASRKAEKEMTAEQ